MQAARWALVPYILPATHFAMCMTIISFGWSWEHMLVVDFRFSVVLVFLAYRGLPQFVVFGLFGTLWWVGLSYLLSRMILRDLRLIPQNRVPR